MQRKPVLLTFTAALAAAAGAPPANAAFLVRRGVGVRPAVGLNRPALAPRFVGSRFVRVGPLAAARLAAVPLVRYAAPVRFWAAPVVVGAPVVGPPAVLGAAPAPELVVTGYHLGPGWSDAGAVKTPVEFEVRNAGAGGSPASNARVAVNGLPTAALVAIPALAPGQTAVVSAVVLGSIPAGTVVQIQAGNG
jgi:hypothetical protein